MIIMFKLDIVGMEMSAYVGVHFMNSCLTQVINPTVYDKITCRCLFIKCHTHILRNTVTKGNFLTEVVPSRIHLLYLHASSIVHL